MTKQDKQLLLKDLCARLPYGVIVQYKQKTFAPYDEYTVDTKVEIDEMLQHRLKLLDFKPYLHPMSSMTEKERKEYNEYLFYGASIGLMSNTETAYELIDWLNKKMFDHRGLIEKDLALEAPEDMYDFK